MVAVAQRGLSGRLKTISAMAQNFFACDREQSFLLPPDVREWLPEDHFAWFVIDAVARMDLGGVLCAPIAPTGTAGRRLIRR